MPDEKLTKLRELPVRKNNLLIQKARYKLTAKQFDIITYVVSMVKPQDLPGTMYSFSVKDFCMLLGIDSRNGWHYRSVKDELQHLADKSIWVPTDDGKERLTRWFDDVMIDRGNGTIEVSFHKSIWHYIYEVRKQFTQYPASHSYALSSKYSKYIYDFLKSWQSQGTITVSIEDFIKYDCPCPYTQYKNLRQKVLDVAVSEINKLTDISVSYEPIKIKSRSYTHLCFKIKKATDTEQILHATGRFLALATDKEMAEFLGLEEDEPRHEDDDDLPF